MLSDTGRSDLSKVTYIWLDGATSQKMRSKERVIENKADMTLEDFPDWGYDGSSTYQATGDDSDLIIKPVYFIEDPVSNPGNYLVLCEVYNPDGETPHKTNKRAELRDLLAQCADADPWIGFEQEYTLFRGSRPLGWPEVGYPAPQGPFYCGVGADEVFGRNLVEAHTAACIDSGLMIFGTNAEVMPGQWEYQMGYRDIKGESADPLTVSDHLWLARWLLCRIGEEFNVSVSLAPKPIKGDWNGTGMHTNFSTKATRDPKTGMDAIKKASAALEKTHREHIRVYGKDLAFRLTGDHETSSINDFSAGVANRGCSIRIPRAVQDKGYGYLEDRRPGANANPYEVSSALLKTVCLTD